MNKLTTDIARWLKIDLELAIKVQFEMMCSGVSFSNSSERTLKLLAKQCLNGLSK
jgi:hypothetical protein